MGIRERFYQRIYASFRSDFRKLLKDLESQGWRVEPTAGKKGHYWAYPPDKEKDQVLLAGTPSDNHAWDNMISDLRKSGYVTDHKSKEEAPEEKKTQFSDVVEEPDPNVRDYAAEQDKHRDDKMAEFLFEEVGAGAPEEDIHEVVDMISDEQIKR